MSDISYSDKEFRVLPTGVEPSRNRKELKVIGSTPTGRTRVTDGIISLSRIYISNAWCTKILRRLSGFQSPAQYFDPNPRSRKIVNRPKTVQKSWIPSKDNVNSDFDSSVIFVICSRSANIFSANQMQSKTNHELSYANYPRILVTCFPRLALVTYFPALTSGHMFSRTFHWLHVFPR